MNNNIPDDYYLPQINTEECFKADDCTVIFSNTCYDKIMEFLNQALENKSQERGTFFFGKKIGNYLIFDMYKSDFALKTDNHENAFAVFTAKNQNEVSHYANKKVMLGEQYKYVIHFVIRANSHKDNQGVFKNPDNVDLLSQSDLYSCRWLDKRLQPLCGDDITYLSAVVTTKDEKKPHISMVRYNPTNDEYTNIENIGFNKDNNIYKINKKNINDYELFEEKEQFKVVYSVSIYNEDKDKKIVL